MTSRTFYLLLFFALSGFGLNQSACTHKAGGDIEEGEALFVFEVQPILQQKCINCHGNEEDDIRGALDLRKLSAALHGGVSGKAALVPGHPDRSSIMSAIKRLDPDLAMPPKDGDALTEEEISYFEDWIAMGAPWPGEKRQQAIRDAGNWTYSNRIVVPTSGGQTEAWNERPYKLSKLWAFLPLQDPAVPGAEMGQVHPVDAFIDRKLQEQGLTVAPPADKRTLIRRATFDLTGLPPTRQEIDDFLADDSPEAFAKVVDRLLESPHYGEQWGRHWLDVVRYADSDGYSNDYIRPNAWRYRDYVIRSFNADKPYNEFVREQLAGDEIDPADPEMLIAAGFLRMGPWEHTAMTVAAETRQLFLDDVTNIVGETFLSLPLNCAKCHDHKYDPIPTRDYYSMQAVFAATQFADREAAFLTAENVSLSDAEKERLEEWIKASKDEQEEMRAKEENAARKWFRARGKPYLPKSERRRLPENEQPPRYYGLTDQDLGYQKVLNKRLQTLQRTKTRFEPFAFSVYNGPNRIVFSHRDMLMPEETSGDPPATFVLAGGSVYAPKEEVPAGVLSAVAALSTALDDADPAALPNPIPQDLKGRRRALAGWITRPDHPLATRSIVNRIWQYHFGKGLSENTNNFGGTGRPPTHPELLDWLARYFVEHGWSVKAMHRLIMSSAAYQRAGQHPEAAQLALLDPANHLLAVFQPRRLAAEELRDAMLFISGELNPVLGGLPIRPEIDQEVALQPRHIMGSISQAYQPSRTPLERNRRTIYAERYRSMPDPMLEVFNQPSPDVSCERRATSTVSPQVFNMLNSSQMRDRAIALALRLEAEAPDGISEQIRLAIQLIWNRKPSGEEIEKANAYIQQMTAYHEQNEPVKVSYPTEVKRKMFEEMTGSPFEYTEALDIYRNYVPDKKDTDVNPATRALADLALVLFNTNEFVYVY